MPDGMTTTKRRGSKLLAVAPKTAEPSRPKICIFGKEGSGKTMFCLQFPKVYYIDTESGATRSHYTDLLEKAGGVYMGVQHGSLDFDTVIGQIQALASEKHEFKTVCIDSITKLFNTAVANEAERLGDRNAFGADKKKAVQYMRSLVAWLMRLDMSVVLTAHQRDVWGLKNGQREVTGVGPDTWDKLPYELDLTINVEKLGPRRIGRVGKSRLVNFPENEMFDFDFETFAERYGREVIEKEARPLVLATEDQVAEVRRLLSIVKMPDDWTDKCFKKANCEDWPDMDSELIAKVIDALREKLAT
jgi:hypothetical protein